MKRQKGLSRGTVVIIVVLCLVIGGFAIPNLWGCSKKPATNPKQVVEVKRGSLVVSVPADGNLSMPSHVKLSFDTIGTVKNIFVSDGYQITKGQILAELDTTSLELAVKAAEVDLETAEYTLMQAAGLTASPGYRERGTRPNYMSIFATNLPGVQIDLQEVQNYLEEIQQFLVAGRIAEARASLKLAQDKVAAAQDKSGGRAVVVPTSIRLAELTVDKAKIALDSAKLNLQRGIITAPFNGIVAKVVAKEGDKLSTFNYATTVIVELIDPSVIEMTGIVDETDVSKVKLGQRTVITVDALPDQELRGEVTFISPVARKQAGVVFYDVTITLKTPEATPEVREGMTASADIIITRRDNVLLAPNWAIKDSPKNPYVEVVIGEQTERRQVTVGLKTETHTEVLSGLKEGEKVVVEAPATVAQRPFSPRMPMGVPAAPRR